MGRRDFEDPSGYEFKIAIKTGLVSKSANFVRV